MQNFIEQLLDINSKFSFVPQSLFTLIVALLCLGVLLKSNNSVVNEYIPIILLAFSCLASMLLLGFNITAFLQGIICWGVSIAIHQTYKQAKNLKK